MTYYVIEEIKMKDGLVVRNPIGYTIDEDMANMAIADGQPVFDWVEANQAGLESGDVNPSDYFDESKQLEDQIFTQLKGLKYE